MSHQEPQIPETMAPEVFAVAARLYAEKNQSYYPAELMQAGAEAKIPPEFIQQAIAQVQSQQIQAHQSNKLSQPTRTKIKFFGIAAILLLGGVLAGAIAEFRPAPEKVNPTGTNLEGSDFARANLEGADLRGKNLSRANLSRANLTNADLSGANLSGANLESANLKNANLSNSNLSHANLKRSNLENANLNGVKLDGTDLQDANTEGVNKPTGAD